MTTVLDELTEDQLVSIMTVTKNAYQAFSSFEFGGCGVEVPMMHSGRLPVRRSGEPVLVP